MAKKKSSMCLAAIWKFPTTSSLYWQMRLCGLVMLTKRPRSRLLMTRRKRLPTRIPRWNTRARRLNWQKQWHNCERCDSCENNATGNPGTALIYAAASFHQHTILLFVMEKTALKAVIKGWPMCYPFLYLAGVYLAPGSEACL